MKLRRVISTLLIAAIMVSVLPSVSVRANAVETAPEMQMQEDFIYTETIQNQDETQKRMRANIDLNWRFQLGDPEGAEQTEYDDSDWRLLNLPHDWTIEGEYSADNPAGASCGYLPGGIGWYRKTLTVPKDWKTDRKLYLEFDGVFRNSEVYINGQLVGERPYGWISFAYDISPYFAETDTVEIAVRVDNSLQPAARWYTGSGIYGHVYLLSTPQVHVDRYGTYVTTPEVSAESAKVAVETTVKNDTEANASISVRSTIYSPENQQVAQLTSEQASCAAGEEGAVIEQELTVSNPTLWDTENPALYRLYTEILVNDQVVDDYETTFGIRTISFSNTDGFFLNGENMKLQGVADHWAAGALGAAVPENIVRYRLQMLKDMGVNAVRTSHNPRPSYFYDICDELGIMVMDEVFDGWKKKAANDYGAHDFAEWWETDVTEWVLRDRNHPSIIIWSIGNETGANDKNGIVDLIEQYDTTRGTTGGGVSQGVSIVGVNGPSEGVGYQRPNENLPFVATEAPHTWQVRGMYETQTWYRDGENNKSVHMDGLTEEEIFQYDWMQNPSRKRGFQSSYDNAYVRAPARYNWTLTRDTDWRMGEFRWTGFDYLGEASYVSGGYPYRLFTSGAIDCANFEKDLYYLYQSMWTDDPMVHILPSWTHPIMEEGTEIPVWVYSNCEVVELFKDGISLGKITRGPMDEREWDEIQYEWLVPWSEGTLVAVGYAADGTTELTREEITTAGAPAKISLSSTTDGDLPVDHTFVEQITVTTTDAEGNFYPYGENRAYYYVDGPAYIRAVDNGSPVDVEQHYGSNNRNAFMGLNKVFLQATQDEGDILFTAASILGEKRQLTSDLVSIDVEQLVLRGNPEKPEITVYYTTDGSDPTTASTLYTEPFSVQLETTVRAAVYADGEKILDMEETFGENEGLYWDLSQPVVPVPDNRAYTYPAENATLSGANIKVATSGSGYFDNGYVDFGNNTGSVTFTVDDQPAGEYYLGVRYNNGAASTVEKKMSLSINGTEVNTSYRYLSTGDAQSWGTSWSYVTHKIELKEGENTIVFTVGSDDHAGVNIDEIALWPANVWITPETGTVTTSGTAMIKSNGIGAIGSQYVDFGNNGAAEFTVTVPDEGKYPLYVYYASGKPAENERLLNISANDGETQYAMSIERSNAYNSIWNMGAALVTLKQGENTVKLSAANGGIVACGIMLGEVQIPEITGEPMIINSSCAAYTRLGTTEENPACVSTDVLEGVVWTVADTDDGARYLVHEETGKFLSYDGSILSLVAAPGENAKWNINGDREFYDYIQHVATGKKLGVDENGLIMLPGDYGEDDDFTTNMAYWALVSPADSSEKTPAEVASPITTITCPQHGDTELTLPDVEDGYSIKIFSTSNPNLISLNGSLQWPEETTEVTIVLVVERTSDRTTAKTKELKILLEKEEVKPTITSVEITPTVASVQKDSTQQFTATVIGTDDYNTTVTWTVSGKTSIDTTIVDGLLTVAADETAKTLTVTATANGDPTKSASAQVTVTEVPVEKFTLTVVNGTGSGEYEANAPVTVTAEDPEEGMQFKAWEADGITLEDPTVNPLTITMPEGSVTLTATYEEIPETPTKRTIILDPNGGMVSPKTIEVNDGETTFLPTPYRVGSYRFLGWFDEAGNQVTAFTSITRDMTLTAHWQYTGGGTHVDPVEPDKPVNPVQPSEPEGYVDVSVGDWYYDAVSYVTEEGLMTGIGNGKFSPDGAVTRAMVWTVLARMAGEDTEGGATWYSKAQSWAMETGVSDGTNPMGSITREQLAAMLYRYEGSPAVSGSLNTYPDANQVSDWAVDAMVWATEEGIINGMNGYLKPKAGATRAQLAAMLMRFTA